MFISFMNKICNHCQIEKPISEFHKDKQKPDGLTYTCKTCNTARSMFYKKQRPEQETKRLKEWVAKNPERRKEIATKWKKANPEKIRSAALKRNHNITIEQYNEMMTAQESQCAICSVPQKDLPIPLYVDHCHRTGKIRGLLCKACNTALGFLKDDPRVAIKAAAYLESEGVTLKV